MNRRVELPLAYGLWSPTILLPEEMCVVGTELGLRYSLLHEWSHVSRRDIRAGGSQHWWEYCFSISHCFGGCAAIAGLPRLFGRQPRRRSNQCAEDYAQFLLHLAQRRFGLSAKVALSIGGGRSNLYSRVLMLLNAHQPLAQQLPGHGNWQLPPWRLFNRIDLHRAIGGQPCSSGNPTRTASGDDHRSEGGRETGGTT